MCFYNNIFHIENTVQKQNKNKLEMCANAQRDGRPAKYKWRPLLDAVKSV